MLIYLISCDESTLELSRWPLELFQALLLLAAVNCGAQRGFVSQNILDTLMVKNVMICCICQHTAYTGTRRV